MYGVLQFSETLHHIYQSTEAKLERVMKAISRTESEVQKLGLDTEEAVQTERQIKEKLKSIQVNLFHTCALFVSAERKIRNLKEQFTQIFFFVIIHSRVVAYLYECMKDI